MAMAAARKNLDGEEQFRLASGFLRRLSARASLVVPGNHDIPLVNLALRAIAPYARFSRTPRRRRRPGSRRH